MRRRLMLSGVMTFAAVVAVSRYAHGEAKDIAVFVAASLKDVLTEVGDSFRNDTGKNVAVSCAASSTLAKRIENGAPADLFISAMAGALPSEIEAIRESVPSAGG